MGFKDIDSLLELSSIMALGVVLVAPGRLRFQFCWFPWHLVIPCPHTSLYPITQASKGNEHG